MQHPTNSVTNPSAQQRRRLRRSLLGAAARKVVMLDFDVFCIYVWFLHWARARPGPARPGQPGPAGLAQPGPAGLAQPGLAGLARPAWPGAIRIGRNRAAAITKPSIPAVILTRGLHHSHILACCLAVSIQRKPRPDCDACDAFRSFHADTVLDGDGGGCMLGRSSAILEHARKWRVR